MALAALIIGLLLFALGTLVVWFNVYTSFLRYPMHRWRGGAAADFRYVSGLPVIGIVLLAFAAFFLGNDYPALAWTALAVAVFDTSGPHWLAGFLIYMLLFQRRKGGQ